MATHSSVLAWGIPGTGEPGELPSMGSRESDTTERLHFTFIHTHTHTNIYVCACVNVCVCITESLCCTSESNTLQIHYVLRCPPSVAPWSIACKACLPRDSPGKNTGVDRRALLQGIFPTQGLSTCL